MRKNMIFAIVFVLVSGCASTFVPSEKTRQIQNGLDRQAALAIFTKYTKQTFDNGGYCGGNKFSFDPGTPVVVKPDGYSLRAFRKGDLISKEEIGNTTKYLYKKIYYEGERKFSDITRIRILTGNPSFGNCMYGSNSSYYVSLYYSAIDLDAIGISQDGLDEMMAALITVAPQASLVKGAGF